MKEKQMFHAIGSVNDKFIDEMYAPNETKKKAIGHHPAKKMWLIAAVITAMVFMMGCAIVYALKMENLQIAESNRDKRILGDDGMTVIGTETARQQVLTLAGLKGTAGYQAAMEWYEFKQEYDLKHRMNANLANESKIPEFPKEYDGYGLSSQEMKDALDAILKRNGLKLQGAGLDFRTVKNMCEALGIERIQTTDHHVTVNVDSGVCYESGNFHLSLQFELPDAVGNEIDNTTGTLMWNRKDRFSADMITIEDTGDWKEWNYTTASGYRTLIIRSDSDSRGWIICDREEALLALQIEAIKELWNNVDGKTWADKLYLTDAQMEQIADAIDFGIDPRVPTQEDVANQPQAPNAATQDGYNVELKSVTTDGYVAHITLSVTAPDGTIISRTTREGHEDEPYHIDTANFDTLTPLKGKVAFNSAGMDPVEDGDGLDNTQDLVIKAEMSMLNGSKPFAIGSGWTVRLEDLIHTYYDAERYTMVEELLAEGEWVFQFTIDDSSSDLSEIEFVDEPIITSAVTGFQADGTDVYDDVTVTAFTLRSMSATVLCEGDFAPELTDIYAVMKDGSKIPLRSSAGVVGVQYLTPEKKIDLEQVDHILLADGGKLFALR